MRLQTKTNTILLLSFCLFLANCSSDINRKLETVDNLLDHDSLHAATILLHNIKANEIKTSEDSAYYLLLKTEIAWQKEENFCSDSAINYCVEHYEKTKDTRKLALSLHYKSGIIYLLGRKKEAISLEKKAELIAKGLHDDILNIKIYNNLAYYNNETNNLQEEEKYTRKMLTIANKINNHIWLANVLGELVSIQLDYKNIDSAYFYIEKILPLSNQLPKANMPYLWANIGRTLENADAQKAISLYEKALREEKNPKIYGFMANAYYKKGDGEKAMKLWDKSLSTPDISFQIDILQRQHQYLSEQDREHEAHEVAKRIIALKDSLTTTVQQDSIREIQEMLDREYEEQEAREEKHMLLAICCVLALLIIIVTTAYFIRRRHFKQQIKRHEDEVLDHKKEIEMLQNTSEQSTSDLRQMQKTVEMLRNEQAQLLAKGRQRYDEIMQGGNTQLWHKPDFAAFVEYYRMTDGAFVEQLEHDYKNLSPRLMMFETLCHMGYANKEIAQILCVSEDSLRSYKARIKRMVR